MLRWAAWNRRTTVRDENTVAVIVWPTSPTVMHITITVLRYQAGALAGTNAVNMEPKNSAAFGLVAMTRNPVLKAVQPARCDCSTVKEVTETDTAF